MPTYRIDYWTCGDTLIEGREVTADTMDEAIEILAEDSQAPLGQVKSVALLATQS